MRADWLLERAFFTPWFCSAVRLGEAGRVRAAELRLNSSRAKIMAFDLPVLSGGTNRPY